MLTSHHFIGTGRLSESLAAAYAAGGPDPDHLLAEVGAAVESCGLQVVAQQAVPFDGGGYTLVWVLAESHLVLHLWPEQGYATADLHVCDYRVSNADRARQACRVVATLCFAPGSDHWNEMAVGGREEIEEADTVPVAISGLDGKQTSLCSATITTEEVSTTP
ncbi:MAG: S-adenosylmethionine decarboxylase [Rhodospirillaceae bacterium]|nr:S-adenosylmethionine decarboxylase [Rhodospirillaceae bacterium]